MLLGSRWNHRVVSLYFDSRFQLTYKLDAHAFLRELTVHSLARFEVAQFKICNFRGAGKFETQREGVKDNSVFSVPLCFYFLRKPFL